MNKQHDDLSKEWKYAHNYPKVLIIDDPSQGVRTRSIFREIHNYLIFIS